MGAFESGTEFLAGVLAKLPEEQRAQVKAIFDQPEAKEAVIVIGDGALARPDYSRHMNDLKAKETDLQARLDNLNTWYTENKAALEDYVTIKPEYDRLRAAPPVKPGDGDPPPRREGEPPPDPAKVFEELLNQQGPEYIRVSAWLAGKAAQHQQLFGEALDTMALVEHPKLGKPIAGQPGRIFSLQDAYTEQHGERVAQKQKDAEEAKFTAEVDRRLAEERKKFTGQPFPLRGEAPSVLDVLQTEHGPAAHTVDSAVAEFERLQAARG